MKKNLSEMKKMFLMAGIIALMSGATLKAQVTIGKDQAPNSNAVLELTSQYNDKGFLPPAVELVRPSLPAPLTAHVPGMVVYNTKPLTDSLVIGLYLNDGTQWTRIRNENHLILNWFYMPPFPINVSIDTPQQIDLWQQFKLQFNHLTPGNNIITSDATALRPLSYISAATDFTYYVTGFDTTVFDLTSMSITPDGILRFQIPTANLSNVTDSTFMNIVLVIK